MYEQAAYYCQTVSTSGSPLESREVYVIGNRQFVNANMAYHAADTFRVQRPRSAGEPLKEAVQVVTPISNHMNQSDWLIYHSPSPDVLTPVRVKRLTTVDYSKLTVLDKPV